MAQPGTPAGTIRDLEFDSDALGRHAGASVYLPDGFDPGAGHRYPVVIVHDGGDYVHYAGLTTVLDNLIALASCHPSSSPACIRWNGWSSTPMTNSTTAS